MTLAVTVVGLCILGTFNPWIILVLAAISAVTCIVGNKFNKYSKEKIWTPSRRGGARITICAGR